MFDEYNYILVAAMLLLGIIFLEFLGNVYSQKHKQIAVCSEFVNLSIDHVPVRCFKELNLR